MYECLSSSKKNSHSWETNNWSASKEITCTLWNPKANIKNKKKALQKYYTVTKLQRLTRKTWTIVNDLCLPGMSLGQVCVTVQHVLHHLCIKNFDAMLTICQPEFIIYIRNLNEKYIHSETRNTAKHFRL